MRLGVWTLPWLLSWALAAPAWAAVPPEVVRIQNAMQLEMQFETIESAAIEGGAPPKAVMGVTTRLADYIEDNVIGAGRSLSLHPRVIVRLITKLAADGADQTTISQTLLNMHKSGQL
ncbi:MAG: hypothetical protein JWM80_1592 [Cyanobacteria bacterium RYN_339]|nr:hypothetical protein [Cyanobacteria bacterium RYN_339]